ncbi:MAG: AEC family transporter [Magnetospirillum sp. WYHS-4]
MENVLPVLFLMAVGVGLRRLPAFPATTGQSLNMFVVYVSLPALVLVQVPKLEVSADLWVPIALPWVMLAVSALAVLGLARLFHWDRKVVGGLLLGATLGNTSFLGIPFVQAFFGEAGVPYAVLYDQLGSFFALAIYGATVIAFYGGEGRPDAGKILWRIVTFPPFLAMVAAFLLRGWTYPEPVAAALERIAGTLVPVVMVAVGFQLTLKVPKSQMLPLGLGLAIKMVAAPLLALGALTALGVTGEATRVAIFEAGMAPMITAGALAIAAGLAPEMMAAMVGLGIMMSFATLPVLFSLL